MTQQTQSRVTIRPWHVVLVVCLAYLASVFFLNGTDPRVFVTLGTRFTEGDPDGTEGYDGQFNYFIATNPSNAAAMIDVPAYRYQRILLPILARLLALGQPQIVPWALLIVNLVSLIGGTILLERLLAREGVSPWYALTYGLFAGVFMAVRLSLAEPFAYALVLLAIHAERQERLWSAAVAFALAALARETTLLFAAGYVVYYFAQRRWITGVLFGAMTSLPFSLWQGVLTIQFGIPGIGSGGAMATSFELIPFMGFIRILTEGGLSVFLILGTLLIPGVILPTLWSLWQGIGELHQGQRHPYIFLLLANAAVMPFVPFSTYREPLGMLRFIIGLVIGVVLYAAWRHRPRALRYSTLWIISLLFAIASG